MELIAFLVIPQKKKLCPEIWVTAVGWMYFSKKDYIYEAKHISSFCKGSSGMLALHYSLFEIFI